ncbi:MAG: hypothetical protein ACTSRS_08435 [Candidatus Helarchaeota archaeon]
MDLVKKKDFKKRSFKIEQGGFSLDFEKRDMYRYLSEQGEITGCFYLAFESRKISDVIIIDGEKLHRNCPECIYFDEALNRCYYKYFKTI